MSDWKTLLELYKIIAPNIFTNQNHEPVSPVSVSSFLL